ncbi:carcinoembryonic antigen-related cell adhesion molecule 21 [Sorex fumeus]|uniref:carcinoembryonic antigen-related cell adhesion molecule 21 n=1 Tax=Sorex fumeus TaxID=62283 RepID=UPI0024ADB86E|nr:carcinoembryonic antigen-related cell adhesion molecule 21 [Sorex fumeus]
MEPPSAPAHKGCVPWKGLLLAATLLPFWSLPGTANVTDSATANTTANAIAWGITVKLVPPTVMEGKNALLLASGLPGNVSRLDWYKGKVLSMNTIATLRRYPETITEGPAYSGRETLYSNGSLMLRNLAKDDMGIYRLQVITASTDILYGEQELHVYHPVAEPLIQATHTTATEGATLVFLTCLVKDTGVFIQWFLNDKILQPSGSRKLSADNMTLTVQPVSRADEGAYRCEVSNPVSSSKSAPQILQMKPSPSPPHPVNLTGGG